MTKGTKALLLGFLLANGVLRAQNTWTALPSTQAPEARAFHTAVWTGTKVLIWGGIGAGGALGSGAGFDPTTNTWKAIASAGAPAPRAFHTAVWTGTRMIVWGGGSDTSFGTVFNTGASYDPVADAWAPIASFDAPLPRAGHGAVWTGSKMIVWGGFDASGDFDSGGVYDPASNTWQATAPLNAPSGREYASTVWTGSRMLVWGGDDTVNGTPLSTGASFNPVSNTWTSLSTLDAPSSRTEHSGIWTGSRLVVWGGSDASGYLNSGGSYDPVTNSWSALPSAGAPSARASHSAVWTGAEMVVFGGYSDTPVTTGGGRYRPDRNSWSSLSATGAPTSRYAHTSTWTGLDMIVFGGLGTGSVPLGSGASYRPVAQQSLGDLDGNGVVDVFDVVDLAGYIVGNIAQGLPPFTGELGRANVKADATIDVFDVVVLQSFIVGNVSKLPVP